MLKKYIFLLILGGFLIKFKFWTYYCVQKYLILKDRKFMINDDFPAKKKNYL